MRRTLRVLPIVLLLLAGSTARANDALLATFRDYLDALRVQTAIPGLSAAIIGRDDVLWMHAFGRQDVERNIPATVDTAYHLDGVTQVFTATLFLQCVESNLVSLSDPIARWVPGEVQSQATLFDVLTHTSADGDATVFMHRPDRLAPLTQVYRRSDCSDDSFRERLVALYDRHGMGDSVPGPNVLTLAPPDEGIPTPSQLDRYRLTLGRLAAPYTINAQRRPILSVHSTTALTAGQGMISTVRDYAKFDLALKRGDVVRSDTLAAAWQPPMGRNGVRLPHGVGWFVQTFNGEQIVWQFGVNDTGSSSMVMMAPGRGLTLVLLANSPGLVRPFVLEKGDLQASPFGRLFLGMLVR